MVCRADNSGRGPTSGSGSKNPFRHTPTLYLINVNFSASFIQQYIAATKNLVEISKQMLLNSWHYSCPQHAMNLCNFLDSKYASRPGFHVTCYHLKYSCFPWWLFHWQKFFSYSNYVWDMLHQKRKAVPIVKGGCGLRILKQNVRDDKPAFFISLCDSMRNQDTSVHFFSSYSFPSRR